MYLLDGYFLVFFAVEGRCDHSISTRADLLDDLVFLVDDEGSAPYFVQHATLRNRQLLLALLPL